MNFYDFVEEVKKFEGFRSTPYYDAGGTLSIGYGRVSNVSIGEVATKEKEHSWITNNLRTLSVTVRAKMIKYGYHSITNNQVFALTSFCYNLGIGKLAQVTNNGKRTLDEVGKKMLLYTKCNGKELNGLVKRRKWESDLFFTDVYTALDLQKKVNEIYVRNNSTKRLALDGVIGSKSVNAIMDILNTI